MSNEIFKEKNIAKAYITVSLPLVFSMVVTLIYNLADTFFVAQTNDTNIVTGVSLGAPVFTVLMALGNIFGQGGSSLTSRYLGQDDIKKVRRVSSFCFYTALMTGAVTCILMLIFREELVLMLGANRDSYRHALSYYSWLAIGAPAIVLSFIHSNLLRSEGLSKESMAGTMLGAVVNIILDPIFISVLGLGAGGAAIATDIGYVCDDVFYAAVVLGKSRILSMNPKEYAVSGQDAGQIFKIGIPAAITNIFASVSTIVMNQFLLPYGNEKIAAMGIALKVSMIVVLFLTGFTFGGQPLYGYYYGAGDREKLNELFRFSFRFVIILALSMSALVFLAAPNLMRLFMDRAQIVHDGTRILRFQVVTMVFTGIIMLFTIIFQSFGKAFGSFVLSVSRQGVIFLAVLMVARSAGGYTGIIASQAIADSITAVIALALFMAQLKPELSLEKKGHGKNGRKLEYQRA